MKYKKIFAIVLILAILCQYASPVYSQPPSGEDKQVNAVEVKNNKAISAETILSKIRTKAGDKLNREIVSDDIKRLYATEYFTDVSVDVQDSDSGVKVTFIVEEKSVIEGIFFKGNKVFRAEKLKSVIKSKPDDMLNPTILAQDMIELKNFYAKKGYTLAEFKYEIEMNKDSNKARINVIVNENTRVKVSSIKIAGNKAVKTDKIKKILATKPAWLFNPGVFKDDVFQEDLEKIKALYDDIGFLDAAVTSKMEYNNDKTLLDIVINVDEGKEYLTGVITIKGNTVFPENDISSLIKMKSGMPFSGRALRNDLLAIKERYHKYGYMNVVVNIDRNLNAETGKIDIIYNIDGKEPVYVGKVDIRGNNKTKDIVIRRELRVCPGDRFSGDKINRSKERLYNLGLFEDVSFDTEPTDKPDVQNLIVNVKETKTGEFSFGGGYSSVDQLMGFVQVTQKNFDILNFPTFIGAGQLLSLKAEIGMVRNNYNIGWSDPWIFGYPYLFGFDVYRTSHTRATDIGWPYDETRWGGDARLGKEFTENFRGDLIYRLENITIENIVDGASQDLFNETGSNWISSLMLQLTYDTRDNVYIPTRGYVVGGSIEDAGGIFFGDKDYIKGTLSASYYHTFFEKLVLEVKGRGGLGSAYGSTDAIPIYERFFAGGANTIRGYKERSVGPRDSGSNEPIGGEAIAVANAELTFPIYEKLLKGAVFYDVGNVWQRANEFIVDGDYKQGAGLGLRIKTPIGPVKLDYGYPLVRREEDSKWGEFYFSMSHGF